MTILTYKSTGANLHKNGPFVVSRPVDANVEVVPGVRTCQVNAAGASTSTLDFNLRIPTDARVLPNTRVYNDILGTTTSTINLNLGYKGVDGNTADLLTAFNTNILLGAAAPTYGNAGLSAKSKYGQKVWELAGLASDPGGFVDVVGTVKGAATSSTGFVALDMRLAFN